MIWTRVSSGGFYVICTTVCGSCDEAEVLWFQRTLESWGPVSSPWMLRRGGTSRRLDGKVIDEGWANHVVCKKRAKSNTRRAWFVMRVMKIQIALDPHISTLYSPLSTTSSSLRPSIYTSIAPYNSFVGSFHPFTKCMRLMHALIEKQLHYPFFSLDFHIVLTTTSMLAFVQLICFVPTNPFIPISYTWPSSFHHLSHFISITHVLLAVPHIFPYILFFLRNPPER